jgi:hypothetical protein
LLLAAGAPTPTPRTARATCHCTPPRTAGTWSLSGCSSGAPRTRT